MSVIITAPHAKCNENDIRLHMCDIISGDVAKDLYMQFIYSNVDTKLFISNIRKVMCNMNRLRCRYTKYRNKITKYLRNKCKVLLDIHSFNKKSEYDIYIIDNYSNADYITDLANKLKENKINVQVINSFTNDILNEARTLNVKSVLLNFNEALDKNTGESKSRIKTIIKVIKDWTISQLKK